MQKFTLKESKGIVLPVLILLMKVNRPVSVTWIMDEIDSSDKTVSKALRFLEKKEAVMRVGKFYQFCGDVYQLPIYWDERIEAANPSPALDQPALFEFSGEAEKFSGKNSGFEIMGQAHKGTIPGKFPESGKISELEMRVSMLERRVSDLENRKNSVIDAENLRETVEIPAETGEFSDDNNLLLSLSPSTETNINQDHNNNASGKIPENGKIPTFEESLKMIEDVNDYYCRTNYGDQIFPDYLFLEHDDMKTIAELHPDPDVISFAIPRSSTIEALKRWAGFSYQQAKEELLRFIGITGKMAAAIMADNKITLEEIDFHYWDWQKHKEERPTWTIGTVGSRIIRGFDRLAAKTSDPLNFGYLG